MSNEDAQYLCRTCGTVGDIKMELSYKDTLLHRLCFVCFCKFLGANVPAVELVPQSDPDGGMQ